MSKTLVVNLVAAPGTGKSTTMAHLFAELKWRGIDCEMSAEYAKEKVWEGSSHVLDHQFYISGKQYHRLKNLDGKVDVVITDSPLILGLFYGNEEPKEFRDLLLHHFDSFNNLNILLKRVKKYNPNGRLQSEEQSNNINTEIVNILESNKIKYYTYDAVRENIPDIVELILSKLSEI